MEQQETTKGMFLKMCVMVQYHHTSISNAVRNSLPFKNLMHNA